MFEQHLKRLAGPALTLGGLMWIKIYVITIIVGLMTGKLVGTMPAAHQPLLARIYVLLLPTSALSLGVGLLGMFARLEGRSRKLGITGIVLVSIAMVMGIIDLLLLTISSAYLNDPLGVLFSAANGLGTMLGTGLLSWAALRTRALSRPLAWTLIIIAIVTAPILFATPLPIGPDWATDTLAFLLCGIGYTVVGVTLLVRHRHANVNIMRISSSTAK